MTRINRTRVLRSLWRSGNITRTAEPSQPEISGTMSGENSTRILPPVFPLHRASPGSETCTARTPSVPPNLTQSRCRHSEKTVPCVFFLWSTMFYMLVSVVIIVWTLVAYIFGAVSRFGRQVVPVLFLVRYFTIHYCLFDLTCHQLRYPGWAELFGPISTSITPSMRVDISDAFVRIISTT